MPTIKARANRQPKEPKDPKPKNRLIVKTLEATEYFDDQKPTTPEPSLPDVQNEATPPEVIEPKPKAKSRAKAKARSIAEPVAEPVVEPVTLERV